MGSQVHAFMHVCRDLWVSLGLEMDALYARVSSVCTDREGSSEVSTREQGCPALVPCIPDPQEGGFLRRFDGPQTEEVACVHNEELGALPES